MEILSILYQYRGLCFNSIPKKMNKSPQLVFKTLKKLLDKKIIYKKENVYFIEDEFLKLFEKVLKEYLLNFRLKDNYNLINLIKYYFKPIEFYFFGSFLKGIETKKSDIDFYIISNKKNKKEILKKIQLTTKRKVDIKILNEKEQENNKQFKDLYIEIKKNDLENSINLLF